jgi:hypothetical protein
MHEYHIFMANHLHRMDAERIQKQNRLLREAQQGNDQTWTLRLKTVPHFFIKWRPKIVFAALRKPQISEQCS